MGEPVILTTRVCSHSPNREPHGTRFPRSRPSDNRSNKQPTHTLRTVRWRCPHDTSSARLESLSSRSDPAIPHGTFVSIAKNPAPACPFHLCIRARQPSSEKVNSLDRQHSIPLSCQFRKVHRIPAHAAPNNLNAGTSPNAINPAGCGTDRKVPF